MKFTNRQIEIIKCATELIGTKGIQNLTIRHLAEKMNFSEPALYRHFKNKNEILQSLLIFYKAEIGGGIKKILIQDKSGMEKVREIIEFQFMHFVKFPAVSMVIFSETSFQSEKSLSITVKKIIDQKRFLMEDVIKSGQLDKSIRNDLDFVQLANIILGSMRLTVLNWRLSNYSFDLNEESTKLWKTIETLIKNQIYFFNKKVS